MKLMYSLISDSVSIDQNTNNVSAFHILDEIFISRRDGEEIRFCVLNAFELEEGDDQKEWSLKTKVTVLGDIERNFSMEISPSAGKKHHRVFQTFTQVPVEAPGAVEVKCFLNDDLISARSIPVAYDDDEWGESDEDLEKVI